GRRAVRHRAGNLGRERARPRAVVIVKPERVGRRRDAQPRVEVVHPEADDAGEDLRSRRRRTDAVVVDVAFVVLTAAGLTRDARAARVRNEHGLGAHAAAGAAGEARAEAAREQAADADRRAGHAGVGTGRRRDARAFGLARAGAGRALVADRVAERLRRAAQARVRTDVAARIAVEIAVLLAEPFAGRAVARTGRDVHDATRVRNAAAHVRFRLRLVLEGAPGADVSGARSTN